MMSHLIDLARQNEMLKQTKVSFIPVMGSEEELVEAALVASRKDKSLLGRRVYEAARNRLAYLSSLHGEKMESEEAIELRVWEKNGLLKEGSLDVVDRWVRNLGGMIHNQLRRVVSQVQSRGGRAVVVANYRNDLGAVCFLSR